MAVTSALRKLGRRIVHELEASLIFRVRPYLKKQMQAWGVVLANFRYSGRRIAVNSKPAWAIE